MFDRSPDMYEHVNAMVRSSLQLRKELESNRTDQDRADCILLCKAVQQHTDSLGTMIDATLDAPGIVAGMDLAYPDTPPTLRLTDGGGT